MVFIRNKAIHQGFFTGDKFTDLQTKATIFNCAKLPNPHLSFCKFGDHLENRGYLRLYGSQVLFLEITLKSGKIFGFTDQGHFYGDHRNSRGSREQPRRWGVNYFRIICHGVTRRKRFKNPSYIFKTYISCYIFKNKCMGVNPLGFFGMGLCSSNIFIMVEHK